MSAVDQLGKCAKVRKTPLTGAIMLHSTETLVNSIGNAAKTFCAPTYKQLPVGTAHPTVLAVQQHYARFLQRCCLPSRFISCRKDITFCDSIKHAAPALLHPGRAASMLQSRSYSGLQKIDTADTAATTHTTNPNGLLQRTAATCRSPGDPHNSSSVQQQCSKHPAAGQGNMRLPVRLMAPNAASTSCVPTQ